MSIISKINKLFTYDLNISKLTEGVYPFIIDKHIDNKNNYIIICSDINEAKAFYYHMKLFSDKEYILIDTDNMLSFDMSILKALKYKLPIITDEKIKNMDFPDIYALKTNIIKRNEEYNIFELLDRLENAGFYRVENVYDKGEYALRGFILDIYDYISKPVRIEFFDNIIENINYFDIQNQSTGKSIKEYFFPFNEDNKRINYKSFIKDFKIFNISDISLSGSIDTNISQSIALNYHNIDSIKKWFDNFYNYTIYIFVENEYEIDRIKKLFNRVTVIKGQIYKSFIFYKKKSLFINDFEIFGRERIFEMETIPFIYKDFDSELLPGDYIVHEKYGIGRLAGVEKVRLGHRTTDCFKIFYKDNDKVFVPVDQIHLIQKYQVDNKKTVNLSSIKKNIFEKRKQKIYVSLKQMAGELLRIYAEREISKGIKYPEDDELQILMEERFPYKETEDQIKAINDVKRDMENDEPMDRLICGDVGYGKTEIAARAIFKAINANKQVAVLVPTTILAEQHFRTLKERFEGFDVNMAILSRFQSKKEKLEIIDKLRNGNIELIIGTHALLSNNIEFYNLGLLIIDEEHKFGVKQKEKIKELKKNIDILYLSATPIPRTLEMALSGIRDISNINTPPIGRKPVKTEICEWNDYIIKNAIIKEIQRGGQVYFINNRIDTLESVKTKLGKLISGINIVIAHAKLNSKELENIMIDFWERKFDILISTTIIESGIDNPNTNTMIINNGDKFGIAQLHQLRGRIGRSHVESYCYVIIPDKERISVNAKRRLIAFKSFQSLGAGLNLALKDLQIRGAGNLLGIKQHGNIGIIGFHLYYKLLTRAIAEVKGEKTYSIIEPTINIPIKTFIPDNYNLTKQGKLALYKEISSINNIKSFEKQKKIFKQRYGKIPKEINNMLKLQKIKLLCKKYKISTIRYMNNKLIMEFLMGYEPSVKEINKIISNVNTDFIIDNNMPVKLIIHLKKDTHIIRFILSLLN